MSFSKDVILSLVILGVVLESDLGRKMIGWFRIARPIIVAAAFVPLYFTRLPTSGGDLALQGLGAVIGVALGLLAVTPAFVSVDFDERFQGWWANLRHRPGRPAAVTVAGRGYAVIWIAATAARLGFAYGSKHWFPHALGVFLSGHHLAPAALTNALILLPVGMDVFRSVGLFTRGVAARREGELRAGVSHA